MNLPLHAVRYMEALACTLAVDWALNRCPGRKPALLSSWWRGPRPLLLPKKGPFYSIDFDESTSDPSLIMPV